MQNTICSNAYYCLPPFIKLSFENFVFFLDHLSLFQTILMMEEKNSEYQSIINSAGNWFRISVEHISVTKGLEGIMKDIEKGNIRTTRCVMSRVTMWGHKFINGSDFFEGIDTNGAGHIEDFIDYYYVNGEDMSPIGKKWIDVFNETPSFNWGLKEIPNFIDASNLNPEGYKIMPIKVETYKRLTQTGMDCDYAEGSFTRNSEFRFEIYFEDSYTQSTYQNTRILEMYIKTGEVIQWSWGGPPLDKEPDWKFGKQLLADLLVGIQSVSAKTPIDHLSDT